MNPMSYMTQSGGPTGTPRFSGAPGEQKKWGDTTSKAGEISRIFVGSVDYKTTSCNEIEQRFRNYGNIRGIDLNPKNFVFVQFESIEDAQNAVRQENGSSFKGKRIEVRLFDKSGHPTKGRGGGGGGGGHTGGPTGYRDRSPNRMSGPTGRVIGGPTGTRHGTAIPVSNDPFIPYGAGPPVPPAPPVEPVVGNEAEIIVVDRAQWRYAELLEQRIKRETGIQFIDMLFLHTPSSLNMTLNDLFERQTVYALVVAPVNEEHRSVTLHVLHNQTEHRNMPLEDAILLINKDFQALTGRAGPPPAITPTADRPYNAGPVDKEPAKLPEEISYLLRTILSENGSQFLSAKQLDLLIDWFQKEKTKLMTRSAPQSSNAYNAGASQGSAHSAVDLEKQRSTLLDNPHVQAALSSLIQIGALGAATNGSNSGSNTANNGMSALNNPYGQSSTAIPSRRHPLMGTEIGSSQSSIPGAPGGLVKYPPPQSYNQYNYQY